jgi:hypothetical protein
VTSTAPSVAFGLDRDSWPQGQLEDRLYSDLGAAGKSRGSHFNCHIFGTTVDPAGGPRNRLAMPWTLEAKIEADHRLRELLRSGGMPQPDEVEYGFTCVRFIFHESKTCVVVDLDEGGGDRGTRVD